MLNPLGLLVFSSFYLAVSEKAVPDTPFVQEYQEFYPVGDSEDSNDVRAVALDCAGNVYAATKGGAFLLKKGEKKWRELMTEEDAGPAFDVLVDDKNAVWFAAWNGIYTSAGDNVKKVPGVEGIFSTIFVRDGRVSAMGPAGQWAEGGQIKPLECSGAIRKTLVEPSGDLWVATAMGLFSFGPHGQRYYRNMESIVSGDVHGLARGPDGRLWAGSLGGITIYQDGVRVDDITPKNDLPDIYVQCITRAPDGVMWIGTMSGIARYDGKNWSLRHSRRWVRDNDVRDIKFDAESTAWVATKNGVSAIRRRQMTLADKAAFFQDVCMARHVREPWIVELCSLLLPGDLSLWKPCDDDNDGGYTSVYMVMESFRYAVTKDPQARENAKRAFETLMFLQTVTDTPGFIARTVVPVAWGPESVHDKNEDTTEQEWADRQAQDPRYKAVNIHWRESKDGKWLWKGDTSSDEVTAHLYGFGYYYDLVADEAEKERVRAHVRRVMDYIIEHGYVLVDIDGTATRWGVWAPEMLNDNHDWRGDHGLNSLEILSYLKTTWHITGDQKYQDEYLRLIRDHHYAENGRNAKSFEPTWRTHIDDELLALAFPGLLRYETDPELLKIYRESLNHWYKGVEKDQSPFFNYIYASLTGSKDPHSADSAFFLRDTPLDLVNWIVDNSKREDVKLVRAPEIEPLQTDRLLPPSERGTMRWDKNPWAAKQGGDGSDKIVNDGVTEWAPTFWLLPYWMGRYYGYLAAPSV